MSQDWKLLSEDTVFASGFFKLKTQQYELPDGRIMPRYYTIEFEDWVNVVAVTRQSEIVLVRQYRPPGKTSFLEIPGGGVDKRTDQSALQAAQRELEEETGFVSSNWQLLGTHFPNPALQTNRMHTFLALDCEKTGKLDFDPYEDLETELVPVSQLNSLLTSGKINHSIVMAALLLSFKPLGLHFP